MTIKQLEPARIIQDCELPYYLRKNYPDLGKDYPDLGKNYPDLVGKIITHQDPDRGAGKKTGIWCPKECED